MNYRDREKARYASIKHSLFSPAACAPGIYPPPAKKPRDPPRAASRPRDFCLGPGCESENLLPAVRNAAIAYFDYRKIRWHDAADRGRKPIGPSWPSGHLCCSQSAAVNIWFGYQTRPDQLGAALRKLGLPVKEVLPFALDAVRGSPAGCVAFEWIGERNYLSERSGGRVARDDGRSRGQNFTSADFAFRFRREDGRVEIVLGEWKYTENYSHGVSKRLSTSKSKTDRLGIYAPAEANLAATGHSQLRLGDRPLANLMYDPFDQLMRLQLLSSAMERAREMQADIVSVMHVVPRVNTEFVERITAPSLEGSSVHTVWQGLAAPGRFRGIYAEDLLPALRANPPREQWGEDVLARYGW